MDLQGELDSSGPEAGWDLGIGTAAQAVATARKAVVWLTLVIGWRVAMVMRVPLRAGHGVGGAQMKRRMGVTVRERKRQ